jgi:hypothetical protein
MLLRAQDASKGVEGRNIFLFVDNYAAHLEDMKNEKIVTYPPSAQAYYDLPIWAQ